MNINKYAKAIAAAVGAAYAALQMAMLTGSELGNTVTTNEWIVIGGAALAVGTAVWATSNAPADPPQPPTLD